MRRGEWALASLLTSGWVASCASPSPSASSPSPVFRAGPPPASASLPVTAPVTEVSPLPTPLPRAEASFKPVISKPQSHAASAAATSPPIPKSPKQPPQPSQPKKVEVAQLSRWREGAAFSTPPSLPLWLKGCELGCCEALQSHRFKEPTALRAAPRENSPLVHQAEKGDSFLKAQASMKLLAWGSGLLTQAAPKGPLASLKTGSQILIASYVQETKIQGIVQGVVRTLSDEDPEGIQYKILKEPRLENWVLIQVSPATQGWALEPELDWKPCSN